LLISVQQKQSSHFPKLHYALMSKPKFIEMLHYTVQLVLMTTCEE